VNTSDKPISIEIKLSKKVTSFPIFDYSSFTLRGEKNGKIIYDSQKEIKADTLEDYSHFKISIPAHSALEIGQLLNDKYEKYNQYFINGRVFNLESLIIHSSEKETKILPETFDTYFEKEKGNVIYVVK
jgi:hypothetical protein